MRHDTYGAEVVRHCYHEESWSNNGDRHRLCCFCAHSQYSQIEPGNPATAVADSLGNYHGMYRYTNPVSQILNVESLER